MILVDDVDKDEEVPLARITFFWNGQARGRDVSLVLERGANVRGYGFDCLADVIDLRLDAAEVSSRQRKRSGALVVRLRQHVSRRHVSKNGQRRFSVSSQLFF